MFDVLLDMSPNMPLIAPLNAPQERARRRLVRLVLLIYVVVIFEGALRKWLLPEFSQVLFFLRDPFLLYAYVLATRHRLWPRRSAWLSLAWGMAALGVLLVFLQAASGGVSDTRWLLGAYGWRGYFMALPLAWLVGAQFNPADLWRLVRLTLWLTLPVAVLVAVQFSSPMDAAINVGSASDTDLQFRGVGLNAERTRPMGPFASGAGQQQFVAAAFALLLAACITPAARRRAGVLLLALSACALLACAAFSGSRGTVLQCALSAAFALGLVALGRGAALKARALAWPLGMAVAAVVLVPVLFPAGFAAFLERWTSASAAEANFTGGVLGRALFGLVDFTRLIDDVPALGYGLGYGGNASITLGARIDGVMPGKLAETDFARHMVDLGPVFGLGYIVFRVALTCWLAARVWRATRQSASALPMLLFSYAGYVLLLGQITGQGTINSYGWLFVGLCIAATRAPLRQAVPARRRTPGPLYPHRLHTPYPMPALAGTARPR